ncbi:efflux RND transporter periplasmic adaptor subunit [Aliikangiella coralliicola]|uniref:Efflux RND transporter periplasmic adaptor subunit n=1 Tax=Aliikangiella coralliicola TaxID=2592383 RepID=A0A545UDW2_9GAMM|nr:efflux RND transporter periplasmic adaptor subunit [Aliikangiella coralliicola]TQV87613.1 efflux RND transporter periplasmic adaptor subunit [Aliikangiella coralliicola]
MKGIIIKVVAPIAIVLVGFGAVKLLEASKPQPEKKTEAIRPVSVYVERAKQSNVPLLVSTQGEVRARTEVALVAQVAGRIKSISSEFTEGGIVTSGIALISIEDTDYKLALSQAQAAVAAAEVELQEALATADVARKQLINPAKASPLALKKPQVAQARARLEAARASLSLAELNLARTQISLPFNGRVIEKSVDIGQYVTPGTSLGRAFSTNIVEVRVPLDDDELASLDLPIGFIADGKDPLIVNLSALVAGKMQYWQGELVRLDASVDSQTRSVYGQVEVRSPYDENVSQNNMPLAVGLYVKAEIQGRKINNATVIPRDALRAGNNVFVIDSEERLDIRQVKVAHSSPTMAIIDSGVQPDERVIVSSIRNPIPGMRISALENSPANTVKKNDKKKNEKTDTKAVAIAGGLE